MPQGTFANARGGGLSVATTSSYRVRWCPGGYLKNSVPYGNQYVTERRAASLATQDQTFDVSVRATIAQKPSSASQSAAGFEIAERGTYWNWNSEIFNCGGL